jgi:hypothetical protein
VSNLLTGETVLNHQIQSVLDNITYDTKTQSLVCQSYSSGIQYRLPFAAGAASKPTGETV